MLSQLFSRPALCDRTLTSRSGTTSLSVVLLWSPTSTAARTLTGELQPYLLELEVYNAPLLGGRPACDQCVELLN